jgi:hypothetical protein
MNDNLTTLVIGLASLVSFVCFIMVLIQMFQRGANGIAIVCLVLCLCCGLGGVITFIYGWTKARDWNMVRLMTVWTVAFAINFVAGTVNPAPFRSVREMLHVEARPAGGAAVYCLSETFIAEDYGS